MTDLFTRAEAQEVLDSDPQDPQMADLVHDMARTIITLRDIVENNKSTAKQLFLMEYKPTTACPDHASTAGVCVYASDAIPEGEVVVITSLK